MAAQDTEIKWHKEQSWQCVSHLCRLCREREETISHVIAKCKMHTQKQYNLWRHDRVGVIIHWVICKRYRFSNAAKWYQHTPEKLLENDNVKILWFFSVQTSHKLEHNKPDNLIIDKQRGECHIIDVACSFDTQVKEKKQEKVERFHK